MNVFTLLTKNMRDKTIISIDVSKNQFRAIDVNFFDSKFDESYDLKNVVQVDRDVYYRNVYFFVKRVKNTVSIFENEKMKTNLSFCLRNSVQI